jgi:glycosyltransferase involved in cell wall biosynthesis
MKPVLHVIPSVARRDGGPSAAVAGMCRALAALGLRTLVATTDADGSGHLDVPLEDDVPYDGMTVRFFRCQFSERFKYSAPLGRWLQRHVDDYAVVHVHAVFSHASIAAGRACRRASVPYVVRPLGTIDPRSLERHPGRKRTLMQLGAGALLEKAARLHYTSDEEERRARVAIAGLPRGVVIPLGVPDDLFAVDAGAQSRDHGPVVTIARLDPIKGIDLLIRAFHQVAERHSERRLVIAGDGEADYVRELRALAESGPARNRIDFAGWIDGDGRRRLLAEASVFVLPSRQENFGLAMVEAMAASTPVIISDTLDLAAPIKRVDAGWVTPRSVEALAGALDASLSDPEERRRRAARGRAFADAYRWPVIGERLMRLYADVTNDTAAAMRVTPVQAGGR